MVMLKDSSEKELKANNSKSKANLLNGIRISNMFKLAGGSTMCIALNGCNTGTGMLSIVKY